MKRILSRLEPTILPMARSKFPFLVATMEVMSSGVVVPSATIVSPTKCSLSPIKFATVRDPCTTIWAPMGRVKHPIKI